MYPSASACREERPVRPTVDDVEGGLERAEQRQRAPEQEDGAENAEVRALSGPRGRRSRSRSASARRRSERYVTRELDSSTRPKRPSNARARKTSGTIEASAKYATIAARCVPRTAKNVPNVARSGNRGTCGVSRRSLIASRSYGRPGSARRAPSLRPGGERRCSARGLGRGLARSARRRRAARSRGRRSSRCCRAVRPGGPEVERVEVCPQAASSSCATATASRRPPPCRSRPRASSCTTYAPACDGSRSPRRSDGGRNRCVG